MLVRQAEVAADSVVSAISSPRMARPLEAESRLTILALESYAGILSQLAVTLAHLDNDPSSAERILSATNRAQSAVLARLTREER